MRISELLPILQMAIGPVILISGVGLLLLSMTNRYARVIDRARQLADARRESPNAPSRHLAEQLGILARRARLVRASITLATLSVLLAALLIITLFLTALFHLEAALLIVVLFTACMMALIASLAAFIRDFNVSLAALDLEIEAGDKPGERR
jgi:hypothetical protein